MSEAFSEAMHHQSARKYRVELALAQLGLKRARLITLIARAKIDAKDHGWAETPA
jgi:hypothetical protein